MFTRSRFNCIGCNAYFASYVKLPFLCYQCIIDHVWKKDLKALSTMLESDIHIQRLHSSACDDCEQLRLLKTLYDGFK